jgi:hypothetical protein
VNLLIPDNFFHSFSESAMSEIIYNSWLCQNCFQSYSIEADLRNYVKTYKVYDFISFYNFSLQSTKVTRVILLKDGSESFLIFRLFFLKNIVLRK